LAVVNCMTAGERVRCDDAMALAMAMRARMTTGTGDGEYGRWRVRAMASTSDGEYERWRVRRWRGRALARSLGRNDRHTNRTSAKWAALPHKHAKRSETERGTVGHGCLTRTEMGMGMGRFAWSSTRPDAGRYIAGAISTTSILRKGG
jgi:hypothetical protein